MKTYLRALQILLLAYGHIALAELRFPAGTAMDFNFGDPATFYWSPATMGANISSGFTAVMYHGRIYRRDYNPSDPTGACLMHIDRPFFAGQDAIWQRSQGDRIVLQPRLKLVVADGATVTGGYLLAFPQNPSVPVARLVCVTRGIRADMSPSQIETHMGGMLLINGHRPTQSAGSMQRIPEPVGHRGPPGSAS